MLRREPAQFGVRTQELERSQRVGATPVEAAPALARQRFRQDEVAVRDIGEAERRGRPERQARVHGSEHAADRGAELTKPRPNAMPISP